MGSRNSSLLVEEEDHERQVNDHEWHEVEVERVVEPFGQAVNDDEQPVILVLILWIFSSFRCCQFANGSFYWQLTNRGKVNFWQLRDHFESDVARYQVLRLLLLSSFHYVDPFSEGDDIHINETDHEGELGMRELLRMAERVLHHVQSGSKWSEIANMKQKSSKEECDLQWRVIVELELNLVVDEDGSNEEHLHSSDQHVFVQQVELVLLSHLVLMFV